MSHDWTLKSLTLLLKSERCDLGNRFGLARALSTAIMQLHNVRWVHKNLKPDFIVFPSEGTHMTDIMAPKLLGFDFSRPDEPTEVSLDVPRPVARIGWFVHPELQNESNKRFHKKHDYYALGVCLLLIGSWKSISDLSKIFLRQVPPNTGTDANKTKLWMQFLEEYTMAFVGHFCGNIYRDIVLWCLTGRTPSMPGPDKDDDKVFTPSAFFYLVVAKLELCRA